DVQIKIAGGIGIAANDRAAGNDGMRVKAPDDIFNRLVQRGRIRVISTGQRHSDKSWAFLSISAIIAYSRVFLQGAHFNCSFLAIIYNEKSYGARYVLL